MYKKMTGVVLVGRLTISVFAMGLNWNCSVLVLPTSQIDEVSESPLNS